MNKSKRIYIDTSVISAIFDQRTPERMSLTKKMWENIDDYEVYISNIVIDELKAAPEEKRKKFMDVISDFDILEVTDEVKELADEYIKEEIFPKKYYDDALHVAIATVNDIGYLLSWNFKHLVKVKTRKLVSLVNTKYDYSSIEIIVPPEL